MPFIDALLFTSSLLILFCGVILTFKMRFVQIRMIPRMFRLLAASSEKREGVHTVKARRALFTAMSTTIGISTIVSPFIAIRLGGPGAILGFLLATLLGTAVNFSEVTLALSYRKKKAGGVHGGPMQYLHDAVHPFLAKWYAFFGFLLLMAWSAAQANQLGTILKSPLLGRFAISPIITAVFLTSATILTLIGGIKRISKISETLVPIMFIIYVGAGLWIIGSNFDKLMPIFKLIWESCFKAQSFSTGLTVGGIVGALRWGVFKGLQSNEAGVGTQTIPHSMAEISDPIEQGILSMVSTYSAGFICLLSCMVALITETWMDASLGIGIPMVATSFQAYFSTVGIFIVFLSALFFAFGTIIGNSYNGSQCFNYLTSNRLLPVYYLATALLLFWGTLADVTFIWSITDLFLIPVAIPHIFAVVYISFKKKELLLVN